MSEKPGELSVNVNLPAVLNKMTDKGYVDVDNAPGTGVVVYRFPELVTRP